LRSLDEQLLLIARTRAHSPRVERAVARFSRLGEHGGVWLLIGFAGALGAPERDRARGFARARRTILATYALNTALKFLVRRQRPQLEGLPALIATPSALSFPSAHASTSLAGAFSYSRLGLRRIPLYSLATGLSLSRVYLGVHYPSDVLAGALLGTAVARRRSRRAVRGREGGSEPGREASP
jgi:membrane-associated phospholipid phosphatase